MAVLPCAGLGVGCGHSAADSSLDPSGLMGEFIRITATYAIVMFIMDIVEYKTARQDYLMLMGSASRWGLMLTCWIVVITFMLTTGKPNPFIYFQF